MNPPFLHLAVNHIAVIGIPIGTALLLWGYLKSSRDLTVAALLLWVVVIASSFVAWKSGSSAAHFLRGMPGIERSAIHEHSEAADWAVRGATLLAILSIIGLMKSRKTGTFPNSLLLLLILGGFILSGYFLYVAHLGGEIRHPEIESGFVVPVAPDQKH